MAAQHQKQTAATNTQNKPGEVPQHQENTDMPSEAAQEQARPTDGRKYLEEKQIAQEQEAWSPPTESGNPEAPSTNTSANVTSGSRK
jgi:hypothetical protein